MSATVNKYISVLANEATDDVKLTIGIKSTNLVPTTILTCDVDVEQGDSEADVVDSAIQALVPYLTAEDALYIGQPYFGNGNTPFSGQFWPYPGVNPYGPIPFTFRPFQTDHTMNLFSQATFRITSPTEYISSVPVTGIYAVSGTQPVLFTVTDIDVLSEQVNISLRNDDGTDMTTMQKCNLAIALSALVINYLGNKIPTASTYISEERGYGQDGFGTAHQPVILADFPWVRGSRPITGISPNGSPVKTNFDVDYETGMITFASFGFNPYQRRPMDFDNFCRISYVAGYPQIPMSLKVAAAQLIPFLQAPSNTTRLKVGSFQIDLNKNRDGINDIKQAIRSAIGVGV
jgi:hypothetical protein